MAIQPTVQVYLKQIVEQRSTLKYRSVRYLEAAFLLLHLIRIINVQLAVQLCSRQLAWDPVSRYLSAIYDPYLFPTFACLCLYISLLNWKLFITSPANSTLSWQSIAYDLIVRNSQQAALCRLPDEQIKLLRNRRVLSYQTKLRLFRFFIPQPVLSLVANFHNTLTLVYLDQSTFSQSSLLIFPFLSRKLRLKLLKTQILANWASFYFQTVLYAPAMLGLAFHFIWEILVVKEYSISTLSISILVLDFTFHCFFSRIALRGLLLIVNYLILTSFVYRWHLAEGNSTCYRLVHKYCRSPGPRPVSLLDHQLLTNFLAEHIRICNFLDATNSQLIGLLNFSVTVCSVPTTVILRLISIQLAIKFRFAYLSSDPLAYYCFTQRHLYDSYLLSALVCLVVCTLINNYLLFFSPRPPVSAKWQDVAFDLIVRNIDQANLCRVSQSQLQLLHAARVSKYRAQVGVIIYSIMRPLISFFATITSTLALYSLDRSKFSQTHLTICHFFAVSLRVKLVQCQLVADWASFAFQRTILPFGLLGPTVHLLLGIYNSFPHTNLGPLSVAFLLLDLILIWIVDLLMFRNVALLNHYLILSSLAYRWHIQKGHSMLGNLIRKYRSNRSIINISHQKLLKSILVDQTRITFLLDTANRQIISRSVFTILLSLIPVNIYFIYRIIYRSLDAFEFTFTLLTLLCQLLFPSLILVPMAQCTASLQRTGKYIPALQGLLLQRPKISLDRGFFGSIQMKLKYELLHSLLAESASVSTGASIGPLCTVTFESLYKLIALYGAYLFCFFTFLPK